MIFFDKDTIVEFLSNSYRNWLVYLSFFLIVVACKRNIGQGDFQTLNDTSYISALIDYASRKEYPQNDRIDSLNKAAMLLQTTNAMSKAELYDEVGSLYFEFGEYSKYKKNYEDLLELAEATTDSLSIARVNHNLATYHYFVSKAMDSAYLYYSRASNFYEDLGARNKVGQVNMSMGIIQKNAKDYLGGETSSVKALRFLDSTDYRRLASANNNLGLIAKETGNSERAIEYFVKALSYREKIGNEVLISGTYNNMGLVSADVKNYEEAINYYDLGLSYDSLYFKRPRTFARLHDNKALSLLLSGELSQLPELFIAPLKIRDSINDISGSATSNMHLGLYYQSINDSISTYRYATASLEKAKAINYSKGVMEALKILSEVTRPSDAIRYYQEYIHISDSIQRNERMLEDHFARTRYETNQLEVKADKLEIEVSQATKQARFFGFIIMTGAILFLIGYILKQRATNRKELQYQESQQKANEDIYNLMLGQQAKLEEGKHIEKERISRELHDGVLSKLFGIRLSLDTLNSREGEESVQTRGQYLEELKALGQEIRKISHDLQENQFAADTSFVEVLEMLVSKYCEKVGLDYDFSFAPEIAWEQVSPSTKVHVYRVVQEALTNVYKHANASNVAVAFTIENNTVQCLVSDNGVGIPVRKEKSGIGLKNIKSRVAQIGGTHTIDSKEGIGTTISFTFQ